MVSGKTRASLYQRLNIQYSGIKYTGFTVQKKYGGGGFFADFIIKLWTCLKLNAKNARNHLKCCI